MAVLVFDAEFAVFERCLMIERCLVASPVFLFGLVLNVSNIASFVFFTAILSQLVKLLVKKISDHD